MSPLTGLKNKLPIYLLPLIMFCAVGSVWADLSKFDLGGPDGELAEISAVLSVSQAAAGKTYDAAVIIDVSSGWHINSARPNADYLIAAEVLFDTLAGIATPHSLNYPDGHEMELLSEMMSVYEGRVLVPFQVTVSPGAKVAQAAIPIKVTYQPCNNKECRAPATAEVNLIFAIGPEGESINGQFFASSSDEQTESLSKSGDDYKITTLEQKSELQELINKHGIWGYFLALGLAFITGLILSFSPCTYPMIPITVSIFGGQKRTVGRGFVLSLFYVGSMAVVYGLMGLIVSLVGGVFGAWLASTPVVIGIVIVFVIFSLSMFGLYDLNVPMALRQKLGTKRGSGGVGGAILLGIIAALVVSPCVGPFVAGILLYVATSGSPLIGFLVLFVFALGLGTLFVIIGTFSSAINSLPNSGDWMESVKKFFGFVLLLMALYFLNTIISPVLLAILTGLLLLSLGVFGGGLDRLVPESTFFARLKKLIGVLAFIVGIYLIGGIILSEGLILPPANQWLPSAGGSHSGSSELIEWNHDLSDGLQKARLSGKPVLIDTWATWCTNCRVLDKKTFGNERVATESKRFLPIKVQLETESSDITKEFMMKFGMQHYSLPTVLLIDSKGTVVEVIQGVIGPDEMLAKMRQVK